MSGRPNLWSDDKHESVQYLKTLLDELMEDAEYCRDSYSSLENDLLKMREEMRKNKVYFKLQNSYPETPPREIIDCSHKENIKWFKMDPSKKGYIYFLCRDHKVVYVGQTVNPGQRIESHKLDKIFDSVYYLECGREEMIDIENHYIMSLKPFYNRGVNSNENFNPTNANMGHHIEKNYNNRYLENKI